MVPLYPPGFLQFNLHKFQKRGRGKSGGGHKGWDHECFFLLLLICFLYIRSGWLQVNLSKNTFYYSQTELCYYLKYTSTNTQKFKSLKKEQKKKDKIKTSTLNYFSFINIKDKNNIFQRGRDKSPVLLLGLQLFSIGRK